MEVQPRISSENLSRAFDARLERDSNIGADSREEYALPESLGTFEDQVPRSKYSARLLESNEPMLATNIPDESWLVESPVRKGTRPDSRMSPPVQRSSSGNKTSKIPRVATLSKGPRGSAKEQTSSLANDTGIKGSAAQSAKMKTPASANSNRTPKAPSQKGVQAWNASPATPKNFQASEGLTPPSKPSSRTSSRPGSAASSKTQTSKAAGPPKGSNDRKPFNGATGPSKPISSFTQPGTNGKSSSLEIQDGQGNITSSAVKAGPMVPASTAKKPSGRNSNQSSIQAPTLLTAVSGTDEDLLQPKRLPAQGEEAHAPMREVNQDTTPAATMEPSVRPEEAAPAAQYEDALVYEDALPPLQSTSPKFSPPPIQPEAQDSADALVTDISFEAADQKTPELVKDNSLRESSTAGRVSGRSPRDPKASRPSSSDSGEKRPMSGSKERPKSAGRIKSRPDWVDPLPQVPGQLDDATGVGISNPEKTAPADSLQAQGISDNTGSAVGSSVPVLRAESLANEQPKDLSIGQVPASPFAAASGAENSPPRPGVGRNKASDLPANSQNAKKGCCTCAIM